MDYVALLRFAQFGCGAFLFYGLYRWWRKGIDKNDEGFNKPNFNLRNFKGWLVITVLVLAALYNLLKAIF